MAKFYARVTLILTLFIFNSHAYFNPLKIEEGKGIDLVNSSQCDIRISFGSYGTGIPLKVKTEILKKLEDTDHIKKAYTWNYGLEGEHDYCLQMKKDHLIRPLFDTLKKLIPEFSKEGYTILKSRKIGLEWKTNWPEELEKHKKDKKGKKKR